MKFFIQTALALQICLSATAVFAGELVYLDLPTLIKSADAIVEGTVLKVEQQWDSERRFIYTYTTISVSKSYTGNQQKEIVLKEMGGTVDGYTTIVPHQPLYGKGEEVLVFLQMDNSYYRTSGMIQGKFKVEMNNGEKQLRRSIDAKKLILLNKNTVRESIQNVFEYSDMETLITNNLRGKK